MTKGPHTRLCQALAYEIVHARISVNVEYEISYRLRHDNEASYIFLQEIRDSRQHGLSEGPCNVGDNMYMFSYVFKPNASVRNRACTM